MQNLDSYREQIDQLDTRLTEILADRFSVCKDVARFKKEHGISMMQMQRVNLVKQRAAERGVRYGMRPEFMVALYELIIGEACALEDLIIENHQPQVFPAHEA